MIPNKIDEEFESKIIKYILNNPLINKTQTKEKILEFIKKDKYLQKICKNDLIFLTRTSNKNYTPNDSDAFRFTELITSKRHWITQRLLIEGKIPLEYAIKKQIFDSSKHFYFDNDLFELFKKTKYDNHDRQVPFECIFINKTFKLNNYLVLGFSISSSVKPEHRKIYKKQQKTLYSKIMQRQTGEIIYELNCPISEIPAEHLCHYIFYHGFDLNDGCDIHTHFPLGTPNGVVKDIKHMANWEGNEKLNTFVDKIACNFLDYLNNEKPKIRTINSSIELYNKRIEKGKPPFKPLIKYEVEIKPEIKIYLNKLKKDITFSYTHKFWVRGHWRHFKNKKYIGMRNSKKWILPYIKGKGILVEKKYKVKKINDSEGKNYDY